jgi:hypothetical protein
MTLRITPVEARSGKLEGIQLPVLLCGLALVVFGMISLLVLQG